MDRRTFITKGLGAVAVCYGLNGIALPAIAAPAKMDAKRKNRIGIQLYSVREALPVDFEGTLKKLSDIGYTYAEAYGYDGNFFIGKSLKELSVLLKDAGMQLSGTHCGTGLLPADMQAKEWDYWRKSVQEMKAAGGKHLVQSWLPGGKTVDELKQLAEQFNKIGELCKKGGIKFGYHNHHAELKQVEGQVILDVLLQHTEPGLVSFQMDMGHVVNGGGDILSYLRNYPKRFFSWHASDFKIGGEYTDLGSGDVPYDALFQLAGSVGLEDLTVEHESGEDRFAACKRDFDFLAKYPWTKVK